MTTADSSTTAVLAPEPLLIGTWEAKSGQELKNLLDREFGERGDAKRVVERSAIRILSHCVNPEGGADTTTGLVAGYVQSGKTLSFTAVAAAARDNGYRVVIVLAGTINNLADQSKGRLLRDLNVNGGALRPWRHFHNPGTGQRDMIGRLLDAWNTPKGRRQTILLTVLKHASKDQGRINAVADLLASFPPEVLGAALIIDDEADQASLNGRVRQGERSAVYRAILRLREALPCHTFLQYTATPQANIFIPMIDLLSPDFAEVLEPGSGYVGGRLIFRERESDLTRVIPADELSEDHGTIDPPPSLLEALRLFLIGVVAGLVEAETTSELMPWNRSMMVHPSRLVDDHMIYTGWIRSSLAGWLGLLEDMGDPDRDGLIEEFSQSYRDLAATGSDLPAFEEVVERLAAAICETEVQPVNSAAQIASWDDEWLQHYAWILVGGQKLDRGFTVEGLTVTYMPRGRGVGLADTIQQRGRFFGYKAGYLGLCRVFLEPDVHDAYDVYVNSEESMRSFLRKNSAPGTLKDPNLKRRFQMDKSLQPTRRSVLLDIPTHIELRSGWFTQDRPHANMEVAAANGAKIAEFVTRHGLSAELADGRSDWLLEPDRVKETHLHKVARDVTLRALYEELLSELVMADDHDQESWQVALALVEQAASEEPGAEVSIIWIRPEIETHRGTTTRGAISALAQGAYPTDKAHRGEVYQGDSAVHLGRVTLQVHTLELHEGSAKKGGTSKWRGVTTIRLWLDQVICETVISQDQSGAI